MICEIYNISLNSPSASTFTCQISTHNKGFPSALKDLSTREETRSCYNSLTRKILVVQATWLYKFFSSIFGRKSDAKMLTTLGILLDGVSCCPEGWRFAVGVLVKFWSNSDKRRRNHAVVADETSDFTSSLLLTFLCSKYLTYGGDSLIPGLKKKPILQFLNAQFPHHLICYIY